MKIHLIKPGMSKSPSKGAMQPLFAAALAALTPKDIEVKLFDDRIEDIDYDEPADLYFKDFDNNGSMDPIICFFIQEKSYPYVTRKELIKQLPRMGERFPTFESYADATIKDVFNDAEISGASHLIANHARTTLFTMDQNGYFLESELPIEAQYSPIYTISILDYNRDGNKDLLLCLFL